MCCSLYLTLDQQVVFSVARIAGVANLPTKDVVQAKNLPTLCFLFVIGLCGLYMLHVILIAGIFPRASSKGAHGSQRDNRMYPCAVVFTSLLTSRLCSRLQELQVLPTSPLRMWSRSKTYPLFVFFPLLGFVAYTCYMLYWSPGYFL